MNWIIKIFIFVVSLNVFAVSQEDLKKYDELEGLEYLETLHTDKKYELLIAEFPRLSINKKDLDRAHFLLARAYQLKNEYNKSLQAINKISDSYFNQFSNDLNLLYAKNSFYLNDFSKCSQKLKSVETLTLKKEDWKIFTKCYLETDVKYLLGKFLSQDFNDEEYQLQAQWVLLKYGLMVFAKEKRTSFLEKCRSEIFYLDLFKVLNDFKVEDQTILEMAHSCLPNSSEITGHLVKVLFKKDMYHSVAYLFENLAAVNPEFNKHTAEFYKVAGRKTTAHYFYTSSSDQHYSFSQLENFINQEKFSGVLSFPTNDLDLEKNKDLNYALQYAQFKFGFNQKVLKSLNAEKKKSDKQKNLIALVQKCFDLGWKCRP